MVARARTLGLSRRRRRQTGLATRAPPDPDSSMHARARRPPLAPLLRVLWLMAVIGAGAGLAAEPVRADGDPARGDVLATQALFLPWDAGVPAQQQAQLSGLLQAAERTGYPVRLAVVASPVDLGTVTELWHRPQLYAEFLAEELSLSTADRCWW